MSTYQSDVTVDTAALKQLSQLEKQLTKLTKQNYNIAVRLNTKNNVAKEVKIITKSLAELSSAQKSLSRNSFNVSGLDDTAGKISSVNTLLEKCNERLTELRKSNMKDWSSGFDGLTSTLTVVSEKAAILNTILADTARLTASSGSGTWLSQSADAYKGYITEYQKILQQINTVGAAIQAQSIQLQAAAEPSSTNAKTADSSQSTYKVAGERFSKMLLSVTLSVNCPLQSGGNAERVHVKKVA